MSRSAYHGAFSLQSTRSPVVPDTIKGRRRGDERCEQCVHHAVYGGAVPTDVCLAARKEILIPRPTTLPCRQFEARI